MAGEIKAMRDVFLAELMPHMEKNNSIFFLAADFGSPVLDAIRKKFTTRFINIGIAEQNLINVSTGLALEGFIVYAYAIAPFISMRCYEQIRVNLAILSQVRNVNVNLIGVGAGYSYVVSGPTHQCLEDLSIMRTLPNLEVFSPVDWVTSKHFVEHSLKTTGPKYIRLDAKPLPAVYQDRDAVKIEDGFWEFEKGGEACIVSTGYMTRKALSTADKLAAEGIKVGVVDMFMLNSFNKEKLAEALKNYSYILTCEEAFIGKGGLDSLILHFLNEFRINVSFDHLGLKPEYNFHIGDRDLLHERSGAGEPQMIERIKAFLKR